MVNRLQNPHRIVQNGTCTYKNRPVRCSRAHTSRNGRGAKDPDVDAYNLVLQGDVYANGPFERDAQRAEVAYRQAIARDPDYALQWVKLALLQMRQAFFQALREKLKWGERE